MKSVSATRLMDIDVVLTVIIHEERLGDALAFVIAAADADGVHVSPVIFGLRMHSRIAIDFARARLQDSGIDALGEAKHVDSAHDARLDGLYRIELVVDWTCGARQVENAVHFQKDRLGHVMADEFKVAVVTQMGNIRHSACKVIIQANDFVSIIQKSFTKVTAQESSTTSN